MAALTRGPLPPSVYWRRRLILLVVALLVIWGLAHLLGGGGGDAPKASPAADLSATLSSPSGSPSGDVTAGPLPSTTTSVSSTPTTSPSPTVLPSPTGACPPSDVDVTPAVTQATAGSDVTVVLNLQTFSAPACTWKVSHDTMQVKITTAGGSDVWSTVQCRSALPTSDVVLYQEQPTPVTFTWSSKMADATCSGHTDWAKTGSYRITGVALGGQPEEASFELEAPSAPTPTKSTSATTSTSPSTTPSSSPSSTPGSKSTTKTTPSSTPSTKAKKKHPVAD